MEDEKYGEKGRGGGGAVKQEYIECGDRRHSIAIFDRDNQLSN